MSLRFWLSKQDMNHTPKSRHRGVNFRDGKMPTT